MDIEIKDNINIPRLLGEITALRDHDTSLFSLLGEALHLSQTPSLCERGLCP